MAPTRTITREQELQNEVDRLTARVEYYKAKTVVLGEQLCDLRLIHQRTARKSNQHKKNIRSLELKLRTVTLQRDLLLARTK